MHTHAGKTRNPKNASFTQIKFFKERISKLYLNGYVLLAKNEYLGQFLQFLISDFKANCLVGKGNNSILARQ